MYYPFAISLSPLHQLALLHMCLASCSMHHNREYTEAMLTTGNQTTRLFPKNRAMYQRLKVPLSFTRYVFYSCFTSATFNYTQTYPAPACQGLEATLNRCGILGNFHVVVVKMLKMFLNYATHGCRYITI